MAEKYTAPNGQKFWKRTIEKPVQAICTKGNKKPEDHKEKEVKIKVLMNWFETKPVKGGKWKRSAGGIKELLYCPYAEKGGECSNLSKEGIRNLNLWNPPNAVKRKTWQCELYNISNKISISGTVHAPDVVRW
ncbi:MAG TPA: hypothetical protein VKP03_00765 [Patescibacteria group bacterium]|nr:hypothetical protein [Patescibacteria group bacterium]